MYVPAHFAPADDAVRQLLSRHRAADLVTMTSAGLIATMLPLLYVPSDSAPSDSVPATGEHGVLLGHVARNNDHWRLASSADVESLAIVRGPDAYISPSWYATKAEHGRVVPTWNYVTVHVYGRLIVHDDPDWVRDLVGRLTVAHEAGRPRPWSVTDAPADYITSQLRAIVGVELVISRIEAKFKLSQNRSSADVEGSIAGLAAAADPADGATAEFMAAHNRGPVAP